MKRVRLHGMRVDNDAKANQTLSPKARRIGDASLHMLDVLTQSEALGIDIGIVFCVWRDENDKLQILPTFAGVSTRDILSLVEAMHEIADRIAGGDYTVPTTAKGGEG